MMTTISTTAQDQALVDDVLCRIDSDPRVDASRLDVECQSGRVTLTGSVEIGRASCRERVFRVV